MQCAVPGSRTPRKGDLVRLLPCAMQPMDVPEHSAPRSICVRLGSLASCAAFGSSAGPHTLQPVVLLKGFTGYNVPKVTPASSSVPLHTQ